MTSQRNMHPKQSIVLPRSYHHFGKSVLLPEWGKLWFRAPPWDSSSFLKIKKWEMEKSELAIKMQVTQEALKGQVLPNEPSHVHIWMVSSVVCSSLFECVISYTSEGGRIPRAHGITQTYAPYNVFFLLHFLSDFFFNALPSMCILMTYLERIK